MTLFSAINRFLTKNYSSAWKVNQNVTLSSILAFYMRTFGNFLVSLIQNRDYCRYVIPDIRFKTLRRE